MSVLEALAIVGAGLAAGTVNTVVGSGTLITFPTLLAFGYPAVLANVTNTVGLVAGSASGVLAYRSELVGQRRRLSVLGAASMAGALGGSLLLLALPHSQFRRAVPALILVAVALVAAQPLLARRLARGPGRPVHGGGGLGLLVGLVSVYGGYFGAAQSVIYLALLGSFLPDDLQRLNAAKNVLALLNAATAAVVFTAATHVAWAVAGLLAGGAVVGGQVGGFLGRCMAPTVLRLAVVAVGVSAAVLLLR
jgi:uncharacterized membrane protein YfcA